MLKTFMRYFFFRVWFLLKETCKTFQERDPVLYAAAIAFFTVFSLPSVLIIIVRVVGSFSGERKIKKQLSNEVEELVGTPSAGELQEMIDTQTWDASHPLYNILGVVFLLFSATVIFTFVQKGINAIWDVKSKPERSALKFIKDRLLFLSLIIILGFLMLVSLLLEAMLNVFNGALDEMIDASSMHFVNILNQLGSLMLISFIFALVFKFLPDASIKWKDVAVGALTTGILFFIGKFLISKLLANTNISTTYGAAGSLAGILVWVFYSSVLVLLGAAFTKVYATHAGRTIHPKKDSVKIEVREIEQ